MSIKQKNLGYLRYAFYLGIVFSLWLGCKPAYCPDDKRHAIQTSENCENACRSWEAGCYHQALELEDYACGPAKLHDCRTLQCPKVFTKREEVSEACGDCYRAEGKRMDACQPFYDTSEAFCKEYAVDCRAYCRVLSGGARTDASDNWEELFEKRDWYPKEKTDGGIEASSDGTSHDAQLRK